MERAPREDESVELQKFANDFYSAVDFLITRRGVSSPAGVEPANRNCELHLTDTELRAISSAFTENFIDPPTSVEINLTGLNPNLYPSAETGGVMIFADIDDDISIYKNVYTVWFTGAGSEHLHASKDTTRILKFSERKAQGLLFKPSDLPEKIHGDKLIDPSEQAALLAMINKLLEM